MRTSRAIGAWVNSPVVSVVMNTPLATAPPNRVYRFVRHCSAPVAASKAAVYSPVANTVPAATGGGPVFDRVAARPLGAGVDAPGVGAVGDVDRDEPASVLGVDAAPVGRQRPAVDRPRSRSATTAGVGPDRFACRRRQRLAPSTWFDSLRASARNTRPPATTGALRFVPVLRHVRRAAARRHSWAPSEARMA